MLLFLTHPSLRPEFQNGVALLFRSRWRRGARLVIPQLGGAVQVDDAIGAPPARTTLARFRPRTALPAGLPRLGISWFARLLRFYSLCCPAIHCVAYAARGWGGTQDGACSTLTASRAVRTDCCSDLSSRACSCCLPQAIGRGHLHPWSSTWSRSCHSRRDPSKNMLAGCFPQNLAGAVECI